MPLGKGIRYRTVKRGGKTIRLALRGKKTVIEATNMATGKTHTSAEFRKDRKRRKRKRRY